MADPATRDRAQHRTRGAQEGNANARKHGVHSLARRLKSAGVSKVDGRSALERLKNDWKNEIRTARGGALSPQHEALLELAANTFVMVSTADDYILGNGVVNRRKGALRPIVEQRAKLARTLRELLVAIGLERVPEPKPTLAALVARYGMRNAEPPEDEEDPMGSPSLVERGRSEPRKFRRDSGNSIETDEADEEEEADDVRDCP